MMNGLAELCSLLHERGVEWREINGDSILWTDADGNAYSAMNGFTFRGLDGTVTVFGMAPEQAVEATLGRGECKARLYKPEHGSSDCTVCECGEINDISANYCNRCGRRIKVVVS